MLEKEFFDKTRFTLFDAPCFVTDKSGYVAYSTPACKRLAGGRLEKIMKGHVLPDGECETLDLSYGRTNKHFDIMNVRIFSERYNVGIDRALANGAFPILCEDNLCLKVRSFKNELNIPFFGGRIIKGDTVTGLKIEKGLEQTKVTALYNTGYTSVDMLVSRAIDTVKYRASLLGYMIDREAMVVHNFICNVNAFDLSLVCELLMIMMLRRASDRILDVKLNSEDDRCNIVMKIKSDSEKCKGARVKDIFADSEDFTSVLCSLEKFCEVFSWKLFFKTAKGSTAAVLSLPLKNYRPYRFRSEDEAYLDEITKSVGMLLDDEIISVLE
ncbi:MAG: hypothetical protein J6V93_01825 [Clostridia bacterium]|nr:hypothetical protein [Clostridia bacterium]